MQNSRGVIFKRKKRSALAASGSTLPSDYFACSFLFAAEMQDMKSPDYGEFFEATLAREGRMYGERNAIVLRASKADPGPNVTVIPRSTRQGSVPKRPKLRGSIVSAPFPESKLEKFAELLCWGPRAMALSSHHSGTGLYHSPMEDVRNAVIEYLSPRRGSPRCNPPPLCRRGNILVEDGKFHHLVLSSDAAASWRSRFRIAAVSIVEVDIWDDWVESAGTALAPEESSQTPTEVSYVNSNGTTVATAYLDTLTTVDLRWEDGPIWDLDERHHGTSTFTKFTIALTRAVRSQVVAYLGG